ncbi:probable nucleoredoxin 1-2 [Venturia canescens]|uniref:probable nucleoredoxin 1-2 n=1 Tax=Venturia canescens TaxID=32260 RepID=UPI001C9C829E|nr:probable nucleoredoxin 1-2 [Venturia canescens]
MDLLIGKFLMNQKEEAVVAAEVVRDVRYVILYYSASWSPPCQTLLPRLKEIYENAKTHDILLEVIFVPSDHDNEEMTRHFSVHHGPWYAVPVGSLAKAMRKKFHIVSIPTLIVLSKDGKVITKNGRRDVEHLENPLKEWFPEYFADLQKPEQRAQSHIVPDSNDNT